jgi:hypothetical protein
MKIHTCAMIPGSVGAERSPFDVPCLKRKLKRQEILEAIRESRERS